MNVFCLKSSWGTNTVNDIRQLLATQLVCNLGSTGQVSYGFNILIVCRYFCVLYALKGLVTGDYISTVYKKCSLLFMLLVMGSRHLQEMERLQDLLSAEDNYWYTEQGYFTI